MPAPFAAAMADLNRAVQNALSDSVATWAGGAEFGVIVDVAAADVFDEAVTAARTTVSLCTANTPGIAEGATALRINGHACRITGPVVPDASGWATFPIVMEEVP